MIDRLGRNIDYIRVSVTDRCQLRCVYCMPPEGVPSMSHGDILRFDEIAHLCSLFARLGIRKIKITGGEPLCRKGLPDLIRQLKGLEGIEQVTLTTNGVELARYWEELCQAGLDAVNISLNTLDRDLYQTLARRDRLEDALEGVRLAAASGAMPVKVNCVPMCREQKLWDVAELARDLPISVRFIEMMPVGNGKDFLSIPTPEIMSLLESRYGTLTPSDAVLGNGPAEYYDLPGFQGKIGFISALSHKFCHNCNRVRLTANGFLKTCLQFAQGTDLRAPLRVGVEEQVLWDAVSGAIYTKPGAHHFDGTTTQDDEQRIMSQIGG